MSELIMTISDDDEEPVMPSAEPPATTAEAAGDVDGAVLAAVAEEGTRGAQGAHPESEDEDAGFSRGFTFSDSGSDSEEEELIHAWDLGEAKQASRVATTGASTLSDKIAATLRRKGTPDDSSSAAASKKRKAGAAEGDEESAGRDERATAVEQEREQQEQDEGEEEQQAGEREEQDEQVAKKPKSRRKRAAGAAGAAGQGASSSQHSWDELQLSRPLLRALKELGFASPTPIQAATVPAALGGRDVCGSAVTGSGKTAAFMLPVLERLIYRPRRVAATRVLVVTPTRELAIQIHAMTGSLGRHTDVRAAMAVGGLSLQVQVRAASPPPCGDMRVDQSRRDRVQQPASQPAARPPGTGDPQTHSHTHSLPHTRTKERPRRCPWLVLMAGGGAAHQARRRGGHPGAPDRPLPQLALHLDGGARDPHPRR
jgi:hypothetical protein